MIPSTAIWATVREREGTRRPVCGCSGRGGIGMPSRPCSRRGANVAATCASMKIGMTMMTMNCGEASSSTAQRGPARHTASLAKRSVLHHGRANPFGGSPCWERPWGITPPKRTYRGVRVLPKRVRGRLWTLSHYACEEIPNKIPTFLCKGPYAMLE